MEHLMACFCCLLILADYLQERRHANVSRRNNISEHYVSIEAQNLTSDIHTQYAGTFLSRIYSRLAAFLSALHPYSGESTFLSVKCVGKMMSFFFSPRNLPQLVGTSTARTVLSGPG
ncbi:hypothetical protein EVAR_49558_1 [Eumeta japonica]|uniref:Secreted protein n=1 Tax=Eumeta variegata TaxID=151549 RepID=A0A4C1XK11_EUMVA|nr:hypothetical protein EVAR_49558_1 [Eumeta japonica]